MAKRQNEGRVCLSLYIQILTDFPTSIFLPNSRRKEAGGEKMEALPLQAELFPTGFFIRAALELALEFGHVRLEGFLGLLGCRFLP